MKATAQARWLQLALGVLCMVMIANLQYGWTLFVAPIDNAHGWGKAAIQWAFTIFVFTETWLVPLEGWVIDRLGPRLTVLIGGVLVGAAWVVDGLADSLAALYLGAAIGGIGAGIVYAATVGNALKWFADRRGLAAGITAAGFGAGSALTVVPIAGWIASHGYQSAFLCFGTAQGAVIVLASLFLRAPDRHETVWPDPATGIDRTPGQVIRLPVFWVMYAMFVLVGSGGLMATAQLAIIAGDYGVAGTPVSFAGITLPALTFALSLDRLLNGVTRPFFGFVSDRIGRETTMFIAFALEGAGILALVGYAHDPVAFVVLSGLVFFAWGEIYSLFPATCGDTFGRRFATTNYGLLYTAKGTAALLVPYANVLHEKTGSWVLVFDVAAGSNFLAAILALAVLRPLRRRMLAAFPVFQPLPAGQQSARVPID